MTLLQIIKEQTKGCGLCSKIRTTYWQIKYACQRFWRGYDDPDVFSFNDCFEDKMIDILTDFKKNNVAYWFRRNDDGSINCENVMSDDACLSEEETNNIIDRMIYCFRNSNEEYFLSGKYGEEWWSINQTTEEIVSDYTEMANYRKEALRLFVQHFDDLWY